MIRKPPYVCNGCTHKQNCNLRHWRYNAGKAQRIYEDLLRGSREGIALNERELKHIDEVLSPLLLQGQSIEVACNKSQR